MRKFSDSIFFYPSKALWVRSCDLTKLASHISAPRNTSIKILVSKRLVKVGQFDFDGLEVVQGVVHVVQGHWGPSKINPKGPPHDNHVI